MKNEKNKNKNLQKIKIAKNSKSDEFLKSYLVAKSKKKTLP